MALRNTAGPAGLTWHKSSYSVENGSCVEVAAVARQRAVRDSKRPTEDASLLFDAPAMAALLDHLRGTI